MQLLNVKIIFIVTNILHLDKTLLHEMTVTVNDCVGAEQQVPPIPPQFESFQHGLNAGLEEHPEGDDITPTENEKLLMN